MVERVMKNRSIVIVLVSQLLLFVNCAHNPNKGIELPKTPEPPQPAQIMPLPEYRIGVGDVLQVKFFYNPKLDETLLVRSDGRITLPRIGDIVAIGYTPTQLDSIVTGIYSEILKEPDITISVKQSAEQVVYVLGEVMHPRAVEVTGRISALQAIAASGGFTDFAKSSSVIVFHSNGIEKPTAQRINLSRTLDRKNLSENIPLSGYDIVYVPKTFIGQLDAFTDQFFRRMFTPLVNSYIRGYHAYKIKERYDIILGD